MKLTCDIVQDLLPLYEDNVCSPGSRAAVEEHLKACVNCRNLKDGVQTIPETEFQLEAPEGKVVNGFRKVRRRWIISLIAVLLAIPVLWLAVNEIRGMGVSLTNVDDILTARRYVNALADGKYEKAANMMDFGAWYEEIQGVQNITAERFLENTERVQIGDTVWYMDKTLSDDLQGETDAMNIWSDLILNRQWGIMVPEEIMQAVMDREGIVQEDTANGYALSYSNIYRRLETPWGTYLVNDTNYQSFTQSEQSNVDYALRFSMLPEDMYLDIQADIEAYAEEMVAANVELYGAAWEMTEKEFSDYMREKYIGELEAVFAQGLEISDISFYNAYRLGSGKWTVDIQVSVSKGDQRQEMDIRPDTMRGGKIWSVGWSYVQNHPWQEELADALNPSWVG